MKSTRITTLYVETYGREAGQLKICTGVYNSNNEWTGESFDGYVPQDEFLTWAISKNYLKYTKEPTIYNRRLRG